MRCTFPFPYLCLRKDFINTHLHNLVVWVASSSLLSRRSIFRSAKNTCSLRSGFRYDFNRVWFMGESHAGINKTEVVCISLHRGPGSFILFLCVSMSIIIMFFIYCFSKMVSLLMASRREASVLRQCIER